MSVASIASKPCQSAQTVSSERAQCVSGMAHPVERYLTTDGTVSALWASSV